MEFIIIIIFYLENVKWIKMTVISFNWTPPLSLLFIFIISLVSLSLFLILLFDIYFDLINDILADHIPKRISICLLFVFEKIGGYFIICTIESSLPQSL